MSRCDLFKGWIHCVQKGSKLDAAVAVYVRAGRASGPQLLQGVSDNTVVILLLKRQDLERNVHGLTNGPGKIHILLPGAVAQPGEFLFQPDLDIKSGQVMPLIRQQAQGHGAVDAARK